MADHSSRRELLGSLAALGVGALLPARSASAQARKGKIDVHYHIGQRAGSNAGKGRPTVRRLNWTPEGAIEEMDRGGVAVGILSSAAGGGLPQPRVWNESAAQLARDYPGRFGLFAALTWLTRMPVSKKSNMGPMFSRPMASAF